MNGLLAVSMATEAGLALFHDAAFNAQLKTVLDAWNTFLKSSASLDKLNISDPEAPGSWISKAAFDAGVWKEMVYDSSAPGYGYDSWNSFFVRPFAPGARPFHGDPLVDVNIGCETTPWAYADGLSLKARFWIKDVDYSLLDLFGVQRQWATKFEGGQAYQGFLSATHYHRWNAPLTGHLLRSWVEPGTYFAQRPGQGELRGTWEGTESQPYLGHVAARAIFVFDHPACGLVALICIGVVEGSTCVIEPSHWIVGEGDDPVPVTRDTEIGHFEFGGSTHMMLFPSAPSSRRRPARSRSLDAPRLAVDFPSEAFDCESATPSFPLAISQPTHALVLAFTVTLVVGGKRGRRRGRRRRKIRCCCFFASCVARRGSRHGCVHDARSAGAKRQKEKKTTGP